MKKIFYILLVTVFPLIGKAQVGIGTTMPVDVAALQIEGNGNKGLIIPMVSDLGNVATDSLKGDDIDQAKGLLVYLTTDNKFYFWNAGTWQCVNPFATNNTTGHITPSNPYNTVDGNFTGQIAGTLAANGTNTFSGNGTIPVGGIIMWSGTTAPEGWALCDGNNGRPDLRGRFIVGFTNNNSSITYDDKYRIYPDGNRHNFAVLNDYNSIGNTDGNSEITLNVDQLPNHNHEIIDPGHRHSIRADRSNGTSVESPLGWGDESSNFANSGRTEVNTTGITLRPTGGVYSFEYEINPPRLLPADECSVYEYTCTMHGRVWLSHSDETWPEEDIYCLRNPLYDPNNRLCRNPDFNPNYAPGETIITSENWDVQPFDNRPPYYVLAFIIRIQ